MQALPPGWARTTLGDVALEVNPGFPSGKHSRDASGVPHLRPMNVNVRGEIDLGDVKYVRPDSYDRLRTGDVLFNNTNSPEMVGKTAWVRQDANWAYSNHMTRIRLGSAFMNSAWVASYLHHLFLSGYFRMCCVHHVNQASIGTGFLTEKIEVPVPPLPEQRRIVAKIEELFSQLDAGVEELKKAKAQLKRYRQSVLKAAFEGKLTEEWRRQRANRQEPIAKGPKRGATSHEPVATGEKGLPPGWRWVRLGDAVAVASGNTPKGLTECSGLGEIPFYRVADMNAPGNEKHMRGSAVGLSAGEVGCLKLKVQPVGTVIFPKRGGAIATNKVRILSKPATYDLNIMGLRPLDVPPEYVYYWLSGIKLVTLSDGSNVPQINHKDIEPLAFPLAPPDEQRAVIEEIECRLSVVDAEEKAIEAALKQAARLRQSILKRAFEGRLVPQDPTDEPADRLLERIRQARANSQVGKRGKPLAKRQVATRRRGGGR